MLKNDRHLKMALYLKAISMRTQLNPAGICLLALVAIGFAHHAAAQDGKKKSVNTPQLSNDSPLLRDWDGPFGGVPPWNSGEGSRIFRSV